LCSNSYAEINIITATSGCGTLAVDDIALENAAVYWPAPVTETADDVRAEILPVGPESNDDAVDKVGIPTFALLRLNWLELDGRATPALLIAFCTVELKSLILYT
jgi:hypothetical protein